MIEEPYDFTIGTRTGSARLIAATCGEVVVQASLGGALPLRSTWADAHSSRGRADAFAGGWIEREEGFWLQWAKQVYIRRGLEEELAFSPVDLLPRPP